MRSYILPKPAYRIFFHIEWHFQNRICKNYKIIIIMRIYSHTCCKVLHVQTHFSAFSLSNIRLRPLNIFGGRQLPIFTIKCWRNWTQKCWISTGGKEQQYMRKYAAKYAAYAAYTHCIFCKILHIFPHVLPQRAPHILREFPAINKHP